jgi:hypothetical protein
MKSVARLALLATLMGCASTGAPRPHKIGAAALATNYETATLYQCSASTGYQVVFSKGKWIVSAQARGGFIWVKPHSPPEVPGTLPTNPTPSAGTVAAGWIRVNDGAAVEFGHEWPNSLGSTPSTVTTAELADQVLFLDVWCETGNSDLVVVSH